MNSLVRALHRVTLLAYPADFRRAYGADIAQLMDDRIRLDGTPGWQLLLREMFDATLSGPRMRWESFMNRVIILAALGTVALLAALAASPFVIVPIVAVAMVALTVGMRHDAPITATSARRWRYVLAPGVTLVTLGAVLIATADGDLSEPLWATMAISLVAGFALTITGVAMAAG